MWRGATLRRLCYPGRSSNARAIAYAGSAAVAAAVTAYVGPAVISVYPARPLKLPSRRCFARLCR